MTLTMKGMVFKGEREKKKGKKRDQKNTKYEKRELIYTKEVQDMSSGS